MKKYTYQKNKKSRREKIGFVTAFSICLVAIGLALWSTYYSIGGYADKNTTEPTYKAVLIPQTQAVDREVTGVTDKAPETTAVYIKNETKASMAVTEPTRVRMDNSLQTMLQVVECLSYPTSSHIIIKPYSVEPVRSETMGDYRAHAGVDFKADAGENIYAMTDGKVIGIYTDKMYGRIIEIQNGNFSVRYCGVSEEVYVSEGDEVTKENVIATVGSIPCEMVDPTHIHIEVFVGDKAIDPLSIISNNE